MNADKAANRPADPANRLADAVLPPESEPMARLLAIMARLRKPDGGCPWDLEQDFATIAPYTIEEAYEVADAIAREDMKGLREELGDLLLQVVFHSQMAAEAGEFDFAAVANGIGDKMIKRHPHVFADAGPRSTAGQMDAWEAQKAEERAAGGATSALDGVTLGLPALMRAQKLLARAAKTGFEWPDAASVIEKLDEEILELKEAIAHGTDAAHIAEELGDVMINAVNLARKLNLDAEKVMRAANEKFSRRFQAMEQMAAAEGDDFTALPLTAQAALWQRAKIS